MGAITVSTVCYGAQEVAADCMRTWFTAFAEDTAFFFVDNSPSPWVQAFVDEAGAVRGRITVIEQPGNPGFAASANLALESAPTSVVALLNPDVSVTADQAEQIQQGISAPVAAISLVTDGLKTSGVQLGLSGFFGDRPATSGRALLGPSGGGLVATRAALLDLGGFDDDLFAWGEDAGLSIRLWASGTRTGLIDAELEHVGGHTVQSLQGLRFKGQLLARNRVRVFRRDFEPGLQVLLALPFALVLVAATLRGIRQRTAVQRVRGIWVALREPRYPRTRARLSVAQFVAYLRTPPAISTVR